MYSLPQTFRAELHKKYDFTHEFSNKDALFHPLDEGRVFICIPPPYTSGLCETIVKKILKARAELLVTILPSDTSTDWFHQVWDMYELGLRNSRLQVEPVRIEFIKGRLKWDEDNVTSRWKNRISSIILTVRN